MAVGDTALSQIDNPATLTLQETRRIDTSFELAKPVSRWSGPIDSADTEINVVPLGNLGLAIPFSEKITLGLAVYSKAGLASRFRSRHLLIPFMERRALGIDYGTSKLEQMQHAIVFGVGFSW